MRSIVVAVAVALAAVSSFASEPGSPLDCSDWVFTRPGFSCVDVIAFPCSAENQVLCQEGHERDVDNEGNLLRVRRVRRSETCGSIGDYALWRTEIVALVQGVDQVIGYVEDRCSPPGPYPDPTKDWWQPATPNVTNPDENGQLVFDRMNGRLLIPMYVGCTRLGGGGCNVYPSGWRLVAIAGFATAFEILQSYVPQASMLGFRVPDMPEGMGGADRFDTYWGDLATVGDWSQAHGLQCGYPAAQPAVGDYLTVADTLPTPSPDHGYYYVTAATYQGQTRYGRKTSGGRLNGRDPAVLPACVQP